MRRYSAEKLARAFGGEEAAKRVIAVADLRQHTIAAWFAKQTIHGLLEVVEDPTMQRDNAFAHVFAWGVLLQKRYSFGWAAWEEIFRAFLCERREMDEGDDVTMDTDNKQKTCSHATPTDDTPMSAGSGDWACGDCNAVVDHTRAPKPREYAIDVVFNNGENVRYSVEIALWHVDNAAEYAATRVWRPDMGEVDAAVRVRDVDAGTERLFEVTVEPSLSVDVRSGAGFCHLTREEAERLLAEAKPASPSAPEGTADTRLREVERRVSVLIEEIHGAANAAGMANGATLDGPNAIQFVREMGAAVARLQQERDAARDEVARLRAENEALADACGGPRHEDD